MTDSEIQALAKRCAATPVQQDPKIRAWQKQPDLPFFDYSHADALKPAKRARLRLNYSTLFCLFSILAGVACLLYERFGK
jgi:hypothetical protein